MMRTFALLPLLLTLAACAPGIKEQVILLPEEDGKVGTVIVDAGGRQVKLDNAYAAASGEGKTPWTATTLDADQVRRLAGRALDALPPRPTSYLLYFKGDSDTLTPESDKAIARIAEELTRRPAPEITIIGHTDRQGSDTYNDALGLRRADLVHKLLAERGLKVDADKVYSRGEREPLVQTADKVAEARNRRVEIVVR